MLTTTGEAKAGRAGRAARLVKAVAYHRNGVMGAGFYVVTFTNDGSPMVATVFPEHDPVTGEFAPAATLEACRVAVLDVLALAHGDVEAGSNSWRGDEFAAFLVDAIVASRSR